MMPLSLIATSFALIFLVELPDKTALASLALATKYKVQEVLIGAGLALLVQTIVGVFAGTLLLLLPAQPVRILSGVGFLIFAYIAFEKRKEESEVLKPQRTRRLPGWLASFLTVFAAEWGDLSQLATAGLVARLGHPFSIGLGAVLGLWTALLLAVLAGSQLNRLFTPKRLYMVSAVLFLLIGLGIICSAFLT